MPTPNKNESQKHFISRCVPILVDEGKGQDQAVAICYSLWKNRNKKSKGESLLEDTAEEMKKNAKR